MDTTWQAIAQRCVYGLQVQPGELVQVRALVDRLDVIEEMLLAVELAGATPLLEYLPPAYLERLVGSADAAYLEKWDQHRLDLMGQYDRILVLQGEPPQFGRMPTDSLRLLRLAQNRLGELEEERRLPFLLVAIPTSSRADQLGLSLESLDEALKPALAASSDELQEKIEGVLAKARDGREIVVLSGEGHELRLKLAGRPWHSDDGLIDEVDRTRGAIVSNLPAGSIYTTVQEDATEGSIWLPKCREVKDVILQFEKGRVVQVVTRLPEDAENINKWLDTFSGEPRRVSHIGIGLNPYLFDAMDWTLVDEHLQGYLFLALGENRYMGGQNESSLNVDFTIPGATLAVDGQLIVEAGRLTP